MYYCSLVFKINSCTSAVASSRGWVCNAMSKYLSRKETYTCIDTHSFTITNYSENVFTKLINNSHLKILITISTNLQKILFVKLQKLLNVYFNYIKLQHGTCKNTKTPLRA